MPGAAELITLEAIESLIASLPEPDPNYLNVVRAGRSLASHALRTRDGAPSLPAVQTALRSGYTLQLAKLQRRHGPTARLCRRVEAAFLDAGVPLVRHAGSHVYLTPPGSTGLQPHYDDHDVFAIQISGHKIWRVYEPSGPVAVGRQAASLSPDELGEPAMVVDVGPGEVLYIPRGWVHSAAAAGETSIHVTIDLYPLTWLELATRCLQGSDALRGVAAAGQLGPEHVDRLRASTAAAIDAEAVAAALADAREDFLAMVAPLPGSGLRDVGALDDVALGTALRVRGEALVSLIDRPGAPVLAFAGSDLRGSSESAHLLAFVAGTDVFTAEDLPGNLTAESRLEFVRELIVEGAAEIVRGA